MFKRSRSLFLVGSLALSSLLVMGQDCVAQTDPCDPDPCLGIPNAVPASCVPVGFFSCSPVRDFICSCDVGYVWQNGTNTCVPLPPTCAGVIAFPDPNLDQAVRQAIGKDTGDIYIDDLLGFDYLSAEDRGVSDLSGLECFMSLAVLKLEGNLIVDVSPLAGLNNLTNLYLGSNQIVNVSPLAGLEFLKGLRLYSNQIVDMCPLVGNPGIGSRDWVHLEANPLSATSCTVCIPQLEARGVHVPNDCETPVN